MYSIYQYQNQQDFIKNFNIFNHKLISYSEKNQVQIYEIKNNNLIQSYNFQQPNPIYDVQNLIEEENYMIFAISQKDLPIQFLKLDYIENQCRSVGSIKDHIQGTERYYTPLGMKHDEVNGNLHCVGKNFMFDIDLVSQKKQNNLKCIKKNILSCIDQQDNLLIVGSFDKTVKIIDYQNDIKVTELKAHVGGVTFVKCFDQLVYSGARFDDLVYQWDIRKTNKFLKYFKRNCATNQRMSFDIQGQKLYLGNQNGLCSIYDINDGSKLQEFQAHKSCLNSIRILDDYIISASGERHFNLLDLSDSESESKIVDNSLKIWKIN